MVVTEQKIERVRLLDDYNYYGLSVFALGVNEVVVATADQVFDAARAAAADQLELIPAELILKYSNLPTEVLPLVKLVQQSWADGGLSPSDRLVLTDLITDMPALVEEAIALKGEHYFIAPWQWEPPVRVNPLQLLGDMPEHFQQVVREALGDQPDPVFVYAL